MAVSLGLMAVRVGGRRRCDVTSARSLCGALCRVGVTQCGCRAVQIEAGNPAQTQVHHLDQAHEMVDDCMASALRQRKPVYLNVCCNLAGAPLPRPPLLPPPIPACH